MKPFIPREWIRMRKQPHTGIRKSPFVKSGLEDGHGREIKPPYSPGEVCWVRETWTTTRAGMLLNLPLEVLYKADFVGHESFVDWKWSSPGTMPQWASRRHVRIISCVPEQRGEWGWRIEWEDVNLPVIPDS